ncbi:MAG: flavodoxin family protein [Muribaculaceae bacterium]
MKVLLMNGSPNEKGCTYTALSEVAKSLNSLGIDTEIYYVGEDVSKETLLKVKDMCAESDGFVIGSPVYYASATGSLTHFLDKIFGVAGKDLAYKPGATVVSCRRGGASSTFEQINKYFTINNMPVVSSNYWNMVHGNTPAEVVQDEEGIQTCRELGKNMAWLLKCIEAGKNNGLEKPVAEAKVKTNYIR